MATFCVASSSLRSGLRRAFFCRLCSSKLDLSEGKISRKLLRQMLTSNLRSFFFQVVHLRSVWFLLKKLYTWMKDIPLFPDLCYRYGMKLLVLS